MEVKWKSIAAPPKNLVWQIQNSTSFIRDKAAGSGLQSNMSNMSVIAEKKPLHFRKSFTSYVKYLILVINHNSEIAFFEPKRESAVISPLIGSLLCQVIELGVVYSFLL